MAKVWVPGLREMPRLALRQHGHITPCDSKLYLLGLMAWPVAATAIDASILRPQAADDEGAICLELVPVRGDGPALFLPPCLEFRGDVARAKELYRLPWSCLYQGGFRACQSDPVGGAMCRRHCWPSLSVQSRNSGPDFLASRPVSIGWDVGWLPWRRLLFSPPRASRRGGQSRDCGSCPVPVRFLLASRTTLTTIHMGTMPSGSCLRTAGPMLSPAGVHALLLRCKVIGVAMTAAIPKAVTPAHRCHKVPTGGPVST